MIEMHGHLEYDPAEVTQDGCLDGGALFEPGCVRSKTCWYWAGLLGAIAYPPRLDEAIAIAL